MPTGYTEAIKDGISFQQFALRCARAFGALITMRDESFDTSIPEKFEPSSWNQEELKKSLVALKRLEELSLEDAAKEAEKEYTTAKKCREEAIVKNQNIIKKYKEMLVEVRQWQPPTPGHIELKNFMIEQLESSVQYDNMEDFYKESPIVLSSPIEWLEEKIVSAKWNMHYHVEEDEKEQERVADRNAWIKALRESLPKE